MKKYFIYLTVIILCNLLLKAQEKYAVLICSTGPGSWEQYLLQPDSVIKPYSKIDSNYKAISSFWNDTYLMWEALMDKGFKNENIFVCYHFGVDFSYPELMRYRPDYDTTYMHIPHITDYSCHKYNIAKVFNGLAFGNPQENIPKLLEDDFLYVWTFDHGESEPMSGINAHSYICTYTNPSGTNDKLWDTTLARYLNNIHCNKKVVAMQQCKSGGFVPYLQNNNTIIFTATGLISNGGYAYPIDQLYFDSIDYPGDPEPGNQYNALEMDFWGGNGYLHGEFNFHFLNVLRGLTPSELNYYHTDFADFYLDSADLNYDNKITINEIRNWVIKYNSNLRFFPDYFLGYYEDPQWSDISNIAYTTAFDYPTIFNEHINLVSSARGLIGIPVSTHFTGNFSIMPNAKVHFLNNATLHIDSGSNVSIGENTIFYGDANLHHIEVSGTLHLGNNVQMPVNILVKSGGTLILESNSNFTINDNLNLQVEQGGNLYLQNGSNLIIATHARLTTVNNTTITGAEGAAIHVQGQMESIGPSLITAAPNVFFRGLQLENSSALNLTQTTFVRCGLDGQCQNITLNHCSLTNCNAKVITDNINIQNTTFNNTPLLISKSTSEQPICNIDNCSFTNYSGDAVLQLEGMYRFNITNNQILNNLSNGIALYNCGGSIGEHSIANNLIQYNLPEGWYGNKTKPSGIHIYSSIADVSDNKITNNTNGIVCLNNSTVQLTGNEEAQTTDETQLIKDNQFNQVFATDNSFPYKFRYNAIYSLNIEHFPFLEVAYTQPLPKTFDVAYNYWGSAFDPHYDLMPARAFRYDPVWELHEGGNDDDEEAALLFDNAQQKIQTNDYSGASLVLQQIVSNYPESHYASTALKTMFALAGINGADFATLQQYYQQQQQQQTNHDIKKLSRTMANRCNIAMHNYAEAIQFFEAIIENPETLADSIFAVIDAGYVYLLLNGNGDNKTINSIGKISAIVPKDMASYKNTRNNLINALFGESKTVPPKKEIQNPISNITAMEVIVYPNPADDNISVALPTANIYSGYIILYDVLGQKVYEQPYNEQHLQIDIKHLKSGFYNIIIKNDNNSSISKKINIVR